MGESEHIFRALIADADAPLRKRLQQMCAAEGLECTPVDSIDAAFAALKTHAFDVVITDWVLPGGSGIDLAIKALDRRPGCGVIVLGATGSLSLANNLLHGEVGAFAKKPIKDETALSSEINRVFSDVKKRPIVDASVSSGSEPTPAAPSAMASSASLPKAPTSVARSFSGASKSAPGPSESSATTLDREKMNEARVKSLPATGDERINAALEREQALVVDEGDVENFAAGFDDAFDAIDESDKTRPVQALAAKTDQEESSESDRAFRIRFRSVPGFADNEEGKQGTQEEADDDDAPPTDQSAQAPVSDAASNAAKGDDADDVMEISDDDFKAIDDDDDASASVQDVAATSPISDEKSSPISAKAEKTVVFASVKAAELEANPDPSSTAAPKPAAKRPEPKSEQKKKKRRRKVPPPSVGTSTVVTSIVARDAPEAAETKRPSIVVRESSSPNRAAPSSEVAPPTATIKKPLPSPQANRIDTLAGDFESKTVEVSSMASVEVAKFTDADAKASVASTPNDEVVALPSTSTHQDAIVALPSNSGAPNASSNKSSSKQGDEDAVPLPSASTSPPIGHVENTAVTKVPAFPPSEEKDDANAATAAATTTANDDAPKVQAEPAPSSKSVPSKSVPSKSEPPPPAVDDGLSAEDLKDLNAAIGGAESAAVTFASDVAGAFADTKKGVEDETSFTIDFDEIPDRAAPKADAPEKTWVVNTESIGLVSAELNDEVWTLSQPSEKTGIHVLEDIEHYEIERKLADGKHASVYLARWPGDATPVALKVLSPALSEDITFRQRFRREIRSQAALSHENVVGVVRYGRRNHSYFLAVELMEGTLQDILRALGRLPTAVVCVVLEDILRGIHYAHRRQVIHRELKPSNVFFADTGIAKVGDFGFAKSVIDPNQSSPGLKLGTPAYFSPEQSMGKELGPRSDLFAVGTLGYEMLTGKNPYQRDTIVDTAFAVTRAGAPEPASVVPTAHNLLSQIVRKLGSREPTDRYQSALEALEDLAPLLALINKRYPKLRSQFVHAPKDVARQLNADEARLEVNRASRMMSWGDSHRPRAGLCFFRATLLDAANVDARNGLNELEENFGMSFDGVTKKKYGEMEKNLASDPENTFLLRELADKARDDGDIWGYARFLRRLLALDSSDQRARNQLDSLTGVDPAAPYGKGRPNPSEKTQIASPKQGHIEREERTGIGLRVPLENKTKLTQAVQER